MDAQLLQQLRAQAIEIDKGIMMIHSALGGLIKLLEKRGALAEVLTSPSPGTATITPILKAE